MRAGDLVAGLFEIEQVAGEGGMGTVYKAHDRSTGTPVALKILRSATPDTRARFDREGRVLSDLRHPRIVRYVTHGLTPEGASYIAMQWLEGEDLGARLDRTRLSLRESIRLAQLVAEALAFAHARGVVHRDIKPSNIFLEDNAIERVTLLDFGIAHLGIAATKALTTAGMVVGTPGYIAPEQARGKSELVGAPADVFSLGCVLFECLTGRPAFTGEHVLALLAKILLEEVPRPSDLADDIPEALDDLVVRMLAKEPGERPADGAAVVEALARLEMPALSVRSPRPAELSSLTAGEQQIVSVIVVSSGHFHGNAAEARTLTPEEFVLPVERLRAAALPFAARVEGMADGSAIAALAGKGNATDQAAQAARCALAMRAALPETPLVLCTGRGVLAGTLPVGEVIDRAARLLYAEEQALAGAPPSRAARGPRPIRLDAVTFGLLDQRFDLGGGAARPELRGEREDTQEVRTLLGRLTPCVGRERELAGLVGLFAECVDEHVARAVLITGGAGVGKSRLRYELLRAVRRRGVAVEVWIARGDPIRAGSPFRMVAELVRRTASLFEGEPLKERREKLRARVARRITGPDAPRVTEFLGELTGTPFPDEESVKLRAARRDPLLLGAQMRQAWEDFTSAECASQPLVIVLEDLHWGDLPSVSLLDAALSRLRDRPLFVLALARPEVHALFPKLWGERGVQEIRLGELSRKASERLVRQVLGEKVSQATAARVAAQAAGNAFYLEELIRAVAEGKGGALPETVLAMVQARLEALPPEARRLMRAASIFGQVFWKGGARALLGGLLTEEEVDAVLESLVDRELLIRRREGRFPDDEEYTFRHALLREGAYGMLTENDRALGHRLAGAWLERAGERDAMALAEHFERGGDRGHAAAFYVRAAEQALEANDLEAVLRRAKRVEECGVEGSLLGAARQLAASVYSWRGDLAKAQRLGLGAMRLLPRGDALWFSAAAATAGAAWLRSDQGCLVAVAKALHGSDAKGEALAPRLIAMALAARLLLRLGIAGGADLMVDRLNEVPEEMQRDPVVAAHLHAFFGWQALIAGAARVSLDRFEAAAASFERAGDVRNGLMLRSQAAAALCELGACAEAIRTLREILATARRMGLRMVTIPVQIKLGCALGRQGSIGEAQRVAEEVAAAAAAIGDQRHGTMARIHLASILLQAGELETAELEARRALRKCGTILGPRGFALAVLARVLLARERAAEALSAAEEATRLLEETGGFEEGDALVRLVRAEALFATGARDKGRAALASARARLLDRAAKIEDPAERRRFLENIAENARTLELARGALDTGAG